MSETLGIDMQVFEIMLVALFLFGLAYNSWIERLGERKDGYIALFVAAGVFATLAGVAVVDLRAAALALAAFAASGIPMIIGDISRTIHRRDAALRVMRLMAAAKSEKTDDDEQA